MQKLLIMSIYTYVTQSSIRAVQNSQILLPQIDPCVISECNVMHYNES